MDECGYEGDIDSEDEETFEPLSGTSSLETLFDSDIERMSPASYNSPVSQTSIRTGVDLSDYDEDFFNLDSSLGPTSPHKIRSDKSDQTSSSSSDDTSTSSDTTSTTSSSDSNNFVDRHKQKRPEGGEERPPKRKRI
jgi:hypothetical protein